VPMYLKVTIASIHALRSCFAVIVFLHLSGCAQPQVADPALGQRWAARVLASDASVRNAAEKELIDGGTDSLPILRRLLRMRDEHVHAAAFEVVYGMGPEAIPFLVELLRHNGAAVRQQAVDILIDLAPDTESVQAEIAGALSAMRRGRLVRWGPRPRRRFRR
jgi:hypothetical protein